MAVPMPELMASAMCDNLLQFLADLKIALVIMTGEERPHLSSHAMALDGLDRETARAMELVMDARKEDSPDSSCEDCHMDATGAGCAKHRIAL